MKKRFKPSSPQTRSAVAFDCPQLFPLDQPPQDIVNALGSLKTLVGKGTLSMPIQRFSESSKDISTARERVEFSFVDDPDAKANIVGLFDLLYKIDKRNNPHLYD